MQTLGLDPTVSTVAAARALQATGIALCSSQGIPLTDCPCFTDVTGLETTHVITALVRLAVGDWTGLVIPFQPLG